MSRFVFSIMLSLLLSSCATGNVQTYAKIDPRAKTITVPPGSNGLKGGMKQALSAQGWKMVVYAGPEILEGHEGANTSLKKYSSFNTRYTLAGYERKMNHCVSFFDNPYIDYDVALIDNRNGTEVFTLSGTDCTDSAIQEFKTALNKSN